MSVSDCVRTSSIETGDATAVQRARGQSIVLLDPVVKQYEWGRLGNHSEV